jgi:hypothetical protein
MIKIKTYEQFNNVHSSSVNEGIKDWLVGGLLALSSISASFGQDLDKQLSTVKSPNSQTQYSVSHRSQDSNVINGLIKCHKIITSDNLNFSDYGKQTIIEGNNFSASFSKGTKYNIYSTYVVFGNESDPDFILNISLKDDNNISIMYGKEKTISTFPGNQSKELVQQMTQVEISKNDRGYNEALEILNLFKNN